MTRWLLRRWYTRAVRDAADVARMTAPLPESPDGWWTGPTEAERSLWDTAPALTPEQAARVIRA